MNDKITILTKSDFKEWIERELPRATGYEIDLCLTVWLAATDNAVKKMINSRRENAVQREP